LHVNFVAVKLSDERYFRIIRGRRITRRQIHENLGDIPVISGHKRSDSFLGSISEEWLIQKGIPIYSKPLITINSNGSVGGVFLREMPKYTFHDDVTAIEIKNGNIYPRFLVYAIREAIAKAQFRYNAKLYIKRLNKLEIKLPVNEQGVPDFEVQLETASKFERLHLLKKKVGDFSKYFANRFVVIDTGLENYIFVRLDDETYFKLIRGKRVRRKDIHANQGDIPVISSSHQVNGYLGYASEEWLRRNGSPIFEKKLITVNMDGSVGDAFLRKEPKYTINDIVMGVDVINQKLSPSYVVYAIKEAIAKERFTYVAKLYKKRMKHLRIRVPIKEKGEIDVERQQILARKYEWLSELKQSVQHFGEDLENKFITIESGEEKHLTV